MKKRALVLGLLLTACFVPVLVDELKPGAPPGWKMGGTAPDAYETGTVALPGMIGRQVAFIKPASRAGMDGYGTLMQTVDAQAYRGKRVRFSVRLKTEDVNRLQLWMAIDDVQGNMARYSDDARVSGTRDWKIEQLVLDVPEHAGRISFGIRLTGSRGTGWMDAVTFETVGRDVALSQRRSLPRQNPVSTERPSRMSGEQRDRANFLAAYPNQQTNPNP